MNKYGANQSDEVHELSLYAADLMNDPDPEEANRGKTIKWVLSRLGLWEEEDAHTKRD